MKRIITKLICAALALIAVLSLAACGEKSSSGTDTSSGASQASAASSGQASAASSVSGSTASSAEIKTEADLSKLHQLTSPGDAFTGYWKITEGTGSDLKSFVFCFDGAKKAYLMVGTMGYIGNYDLSVKNGENVFTTKLVFGLDGDYTYSFFQNNQIVELKNVSDNTTTTMEKIESFSSIPEAPEDPQIDEAILGAWLDDTGAYLYFGKDGIMYSAQKNINFTFYTYSAADGKIKAVSAMTEPIEDEFTYKLDGNTLVFNRYNYKKISADELV